MIVHNVTILTPQKLLGNETPWRLRETLRNTIKLLLTFWRSWKQLKTFLKPTGILWKPKTPSLQWKFDWIFLYFGPILVCHTKFEWAGQLKIRITDPCWYWRNHFRTSFSYTSFSLIKTIQLTTCIHYFR